MKTLSLISDPSRRNPPLLITTRLASQLQATREVRRALPTLALGPAQTSGQQPVAYLSERTLAGASLTRRAYLRGPRIVWRIAE